MTYTVERCLFCKTPLIKGELFTCTRCASDQILKQIHVPLEAQPGLVCVVDKLPVCNFCERNTMFDFVAKIGGMSGWAHGCMMHYHMHRLSAKLGVGLAQLWITEDQVGASDLPGGNE